MTSSGHASRSRNAPACLLLAAAACAVGTAVASHHPLMPVTVTSVFLLWCALVAWRPGLWLFAVPAALPLLSFAPWTGWVVVEEFDLLLWGAVAGGYARMAMTARDPHEASRSARSDRLVGGLATGFGILTVVAFVRGLSVAGHGSFDWFQSYTDPLNSEGS